MLDDRRDATGEILRRLGVLETGQLSLREEMVAVRELVGQDIRAYELFKRLLVSIDTPLQYDHDTVFLTNDEERGLIHGLITRERKREARQEIAEEDRQWWAKKWGRVTVATGAILGASTIVVNAIATVSALAQHVPHP